VRAGQHEEPDQRADLAAEQNRLPPYLVGEAPEQRPREQLEQREGRDEQRGLERRCREALGVDRKQRDDEREAADVDEYDEKDRSDG
jgi:hypothetical protein